MFASSVCLSSWLFRAGGQVDGVFCKGHWLRVGLRGCLDMYNVDYNIQVHIIVEYASFIAIIYCTRCLVSVVL